MTLENFQYKRPDGVVFRSDRKKSVIAGGNRWKGFRDLPNRVCNRRRKTQGKLGFLSFVSEMEER